MNQGPFKEPPFVEPRRKKRFVTLLFLIGGAVALSGFVFLLRLNRGRDILKADVSFDGYQFRITNREKTPLMELEVILNHRYSPQWKSPLPQGIPPGQTIQVPLASFWTKDGVRFYITDQVRHLLIRATVKGRRKSLARTYL